MLAKPLQSIFLWPNFTLQWRESHLKQIPLLADTWFQMREALQSFGSTAKAVVVAVGVLFVVLKIGLAGLKWKDPHQMILRNDTQKLEPPQVSKPGRWTISKSGPSAFAFKLGTLSNPRAEASPKTIGEQYFQVHPSARKKAPETRRYERSGSSHSSIDDPEGLLNPVTGEACISRSPVPPLEEDFTKTTTGLNLPLANILNHMK